MRVSLSAAVSLIEGIALLSIVWSLSTLTINAHQNPTRPDISGGAALIFKRPENPKTGRGEQATSKQKSSNDSLNDQVDDAIALGNAARDRKPPDLESAEKAYRLASKLNPRDPRPYLGLGNLYWDQRRYAEAAKAYRDALRYIQRKIALFAALFKGSVGAAIGKHEPTDYESFVTQTQIYLAATLLQDHRFLSAERELRAVLIREQSGGEWNAMLGYSLSSQGRYTEASASYQSAVRAEPSNQTYKDLLDASLLKAREASANDEPMSSQLKNTSWEIQQDAASGIKLTCKFKDSDTLDCTPLNNKVAQPRANWRISDGLLVLKFTSAQRRFCVGQLRGGAIAVKCSAANLETEELWTRLDK